MEDPAVSERTYPSEFLAQAAGRTPSFGSVIFPRRGFSMTEGLVLANIAVAALMLLLWKGEYADQLGLLVLRWYPAAARGNIACLLATLFIHAGPRHLLLNMASLLAVSSAVEYLFGGRRTLAAYLLTGLGGAVLSMIRHRGPVLSVGASGAIFGLAGVLAVFLLRFHRRLPEAQRWKTRRIYAPLMVLLFLPSLFQADGWAHLGGLGSGILLGLLLGPAERIRRALATPYWSAPFEGGGGVVES